jgi:exodeoxyribonuclease V beta subunit
VRSFDVLNPKESLLGPHLLEASAGTGKTFVIEHLYVHFLLEGLQVEQILAITFTRAAASELRVRIRKNLVKAIEKVQGEGGDPLRKLKGALARFDHAQIFTIHGFCQRMLKEFSLEASFYVSEGDETSFRRAILPSLLDFLETQTVLSPAQIGCLPDLSERLLKAKAPTKDPGSFATDCRAIEEAISKWQKEPPSLSFIQEEFERLRPHFKISGFEAKGFEEALVRLGDLFVHPRGLLDVSILQFLDPDNLKKGKSISSEFFHWCRAHLLPPLERAMDPKVNFERLRFAWQKPFEKLMEERGLFSPDHLLQCMKEALARPDFVQAVQNKIGLAIIDEFQDTDAIQWEIFSTLFFGNNRSFYLVGDPKQSIYRFRDADLYTYYQARSLLGEEACYSLDTNYRSTPALVSALNSFFGDEQVHPWLVLPREGRAESYRPVFAGIKEEWEAGDGKCNLQFFSVSEEEELPYIVQEIERLSSLFPHYGSFAVLVKDRYQGEEVRAFLQKENLPAWIKNRTPLKKSLALTALEELFEALYFPRDSSRVQICLAGPFLSSHEQLFEWKALFDLEGLPSLLRQVASRLDSNQIIEKLLEIKILSLETLKRAFRELEDADPEEQNAEENAIQIMTMHGSKGLEFDVVFALGAAHNAPQKDEEENAEKLRQLYVAFTRAKYRLYVPLIHKSKDESPLALFFRKSKLGSGHVEIVEKLRASQSKIGLDSFIPEERQRKEFVPPKKEERTRTSVVHSERNILSYTSLSQREAHAAVSHTPIASDEKTLHTLPRGKDTGILLHQMFEEVLTKRVPTLLKGWEVPLEELIRKVQALPLLQGISSCGIEVEFLFSRAPHFMKGFIDLVFMSQGKLYFLDWKTNWLGDSDAHYREEHLRQAMTEGDYWLQASLYAQALMRAFPDVPFGGAYYVFLRGIDAEGRGVLFFQPERPL